MKTPSDMFIGSIHETNKCGNLVVLDYETAHKVSIEFINTGYRKVTQTSHIRIRSVTDPLARLNCGVGFIGIGSVKPSIKGVKCQAYVRWHAMMARCYTRIESTKTYSDCTVCDEWHNFQNFAKWFNYNASLKEGRFDLDKDVLIDGNRIYSPSSCLLIPHQLNSEKAIAKIHGIKDEHGKVHQVRNLSRFCRENALNSSSLRATKLISGRWHKGFKLEYTS